MCQGMVGLRAANDRLRELLTARDAEVAQLRVLVAELHAKVADLAARTQENSKNSSRPPSSDGLASRRRSRCGRSPRNPGRVTGLTAVRDNAARASGISSSATAW